MLDLSKVYAYGQFITNSLWNEFRALLEAKFDAGITSSDIAAGGVSLANLANQKSILVQIVEGESPSADDCTPIGKCTVRDLPPNLPAKSPIDVFFHYEANGRLNVRVAVPNAECEVETEIVRENSLSKEHLDGWRQYICGQDPTEYR